MVVVLIIGILASIGIPYYKKTVETSKATDSIAIGHMLSNSYRMFKLDYPGVNLSGSLSNGCNSGGCSTSDYTACRLVRCNYVAPQDWNSSAYAFSVGLSCGGANTACTQRSNGDGVYANWGYSFDAAGACSNLNGAPSCPQF